MADEDEFLTQLDADLTATRKAAGGTWPAFIVRALWHHPNGRARPDVYASIKLDAGKRGKNIPRTFDQTVQQSFERHNAGSAVFKGPTSDDIFCFPKGKGVGFWGLNRERAEGWMRSQGQMGDVG